MDYCAVGEETGQGLTDQAVAGLAKALGRRQKKVNKQVKKGMATKAQPQAGNEAAVGAETTGKAARNTSGKKPANSSKASKARKRDSSGMCKEAQD